MPLTDWLEKNGFIKQAAPNPKPAMSASPLPPMPGSASARETVQSVETEANTSKFDQYFSNLFQKANFPGPDYYEFWKLMERLKSRIPDHSARALEAFDMLGAISSDKPITKQWLIETATKYLEVIRKDRTETQKDIEAIDKNEIGAIQAEIDSIQASIASTQSQINDLQQKASELSERLKQKQISFTEEKNKLEQNKAGYLAASDAALANIQSDIKLIETTLP